MTIATGGPQPVECLDTGETGSRRLTSAEVAAVARALSNPTRLRIVQLFREQCPRNVGDLVGELHLAQSTVSTHLRILREAGVIHTVRTNPHAWMCMNRAVIGAFTAYVHALTERDDRGRSDDQLAD
jgi:ArsR family transcriptional regulator